MAKVILKIRRSPSTVSSRDIRKAVTTAYHQTEAISRGHLTVVVTRRVLTKGKDEAVRVQGRTGVAHINV